MRAVAPLRPSTCACTAALHFPLAVHAMTFISFGTRIAPIDSEARPLAPIVVSAASSTALAPLRRRSCTELGVLALTSFLSLAPASLQSQPVLHDAVAPCVGGTSTPAPVRDLEPMRLEYAGTFATAGQTMSITSALVVTPHPAGGWAVTERALLPRGVAVDSARLDATSLAPRERTIQQGRLQIALAFTNDAAIGTVTTGGEARPIAAKLCGPLVGDGAGAFLVIGRLALAAGYHATIQHFDVQRANVATRQLVVLGSERASVPAGSFDAWKVALSDAGIGGLTTIWVDKTSLVPVKFSTAQGPVTITMELVR